MCGSKLQLLTTKVSKNHLVAIEQGLLNHEQIGMIMEAVLARAVGKPNYPPSSIESGDADDEVLVRVGGEYFTWSLLRCTLSKVGD